MGPFDGLTTAQRQQIREAHAAAKQAAKPHRGTCSVCSRENLRLKKDGTVGHHVDAQLLGGSHLMPNGGRCSGSGKQPKED